MGACGHTSGSQQATQFKFSTILQGKFSQGQPAVPTWAARASTSAWPLASAFMLSTSCGRWRRCRGWSFLSFHAVTVPSLASPFFCRA